MNFSFEVPIEHLEYFADLQDFTFSLSFLFENNKYREYMKTLDSCSLTIDNSFNELNRPDSVDRLIRLAEEFPFATIVSPDNPDWGIMEQIEQAEILRDEIPNNILTPINSVSWIGYYRSKGFNNLTMGYGLRTLNLLDLGLLKGMHFLGLNSIDELFYGKPRSCDTGLPVKLALEYLTIEDWVRKGCPHTQLVPKFFDIKLKNIQLEIARENMEVLKTIGRMV